MTAYEPRPGSLPQRVLAYLELQPHGTELLTSQLGEALGVPPVNIPSCMGAALEAGLLYRRQKIAHQRAPAYWSLVDHSASKLAAAVNGAHDDDEAADPPPAPPSANGRAVDVVQHMAARTPRLRAVAPALAALRIALWSDGTLQIERGAGQPAVSFNREETRAIVRYLDQVWMDRDPETIGATA
jgi:hypothetical protein